MVPLRDTPANKLFNSFTGHVTPKKSRIITIHGNPDPLNWLKIRQLHNSLKIAAKARRFKNKVFKQAVATKDVAACQRRFLESIGIPCTDLPYEASPILICRPDKFIYELRISFLPFCSFTDAKEAELSCIALQQGGYPSAHILQRDLSN